MKLAWVTGARGFLGRHAARRLAACGWRVCGIGHGDWAADEALAWGVSEWQEADVDLPRLRRLAESTGAPDLVFHAAGSGSVGFSLEQPFADFQRTVATTAALVELVRTCNPAAHVIYPSSAAVYGISGNLPVIESAVAAPVSPYGAHKLMAEQLCRSATQHFGVRCTVIRYFSVYGPGLRKQLLWDLTRQLVAQPREICLHGTGDETRDFLHVEDAARLVALLATTGRAPTLINGGTGIAPRVSLVAECVAAACSERTAIRFNGQTRPGDPPHYQADVHQLSQIGFSPTRSWQDGLREYVEWAVRIMNGEC